MTRDPHAKGKTRVRGVLSRLASLELVPRLTPSFWHKTTGPTVLSHDTKPCRRTSAWEAIRTDTISKSILFKALAPVVQRLDSAIHRINHYPADKF